MAVDADITPAWIAQQLQDPSARPALTDAMVGAFEDSTGDIHIPRVVCEQLSTGGNQIAGEGLVKIEEITSNDPDDLMEKLNEAIKVINKARLG